MNSKTILLSLLTTSFLYSSEKPKELTLEQFQNCINKAEELVKANNLIAKRKEELHLFSEEMNSFKESIVVIDKYIDNYQKNYQEELDELAYRGFELEDLDEKDKEYKSVKKRVLELEETINKYRNTKYFQGLVTTKETLTKLSKEGNKYFSKTFERIFQDEKEHKKYTEKLLEKCVTNKTVKPEVEKEICSKNTNSFFCNEK